MLYISGVFAGTVTMVDQDKDGVWYVHYTALDGTQVCWFLEDPDLEVR